MADITYKVMFEAWRNQDHISPPGSVKTKEFLKNFIKDRSSRLLDDNILDAKLHAYCIYLARRWRAVNFDRKWFESKYAEWLKTKLELPTKAASLLEKMPSDESPVAGNFYNTDVYFYIDYC